MGLSRRPRGHMFLRMPPRRRIPHTGCRRTLQDRSGVCPEVQGEQGVKGNDKVIDALNRALTIELTAINQYFCQAKMCQNWGFLKLYHKHYQESMGEMKHAEKIIERILFLEGTPEIARYDVIRVGSNIKEQFENDLKLEMGGVQHYNQTIALCNQLGDHGTRDLLEPILRESEEHVDWLETQLGLIGTITLENYLTEQMGNDEDEED
jgi:bacterioferritin